MAISFGGGEDLQLEKEGGEVGAVAVFMAGTVEADQVLY